jgi:O-antigen ligase
MKLSLPSKGKFPEASREAWLRAAVIAGTLLIAAGIGLRYASRLPKLLVLAVIGSMGLVLALQQLPWGVIALIPVSFLVDLQVGTGTNVQLNATFLMVIFLVGTWLLRMLVVEKQFRLAPSPANLPALLFIGSCVLAWLASFLPWLPLAAERPSLPAQLGAFLLYTLSIGGFLLAANTLNSLRLIKIFTWTYLAFATVYLLATVISRNYAFVYKWFVDGQFGQSIFWTLLATLAAGQALFNRGLKLPLRGGLMAVSVLTVGYLMIYRSSWISGWLPAMIALGVLVWLWDWRAGVAMSLAALALAPIFSGYLTNQVNDPTQQWSTYSRFATWPVVFEMIKVNPLTGLGPANYVFYTSLYSLVGYFIRFNSHNNYFDIVLQVGFIGMAFFLWLTATILRAGWRLRKLTQDHFVRAYVNAVLAGFVAVLFSGALGDWFLPFIYNIGINGFQGSLYIWLFTGGLMSLYGLQMNNLEERGK